MLFLYFLLGHLLGDFVLQTDKIIILKNKSWKGVFFHAAIHFFTYAAIFLPFTWNLPVITTFFAVALLHFAIDQKKISWEKKNHDYVKSFFIDQGLHVIVLLAASFFINRFTFFGEQIAKNAFANRYIVVYLILAIVLSYGVEVVQLKFEREKQPHIGFKPNFWAIFKRLFIFSLGYLTFMILSFYEVAKTLLL